MRPAHPVTKTYYNICVNVLIYEIMCLLQINPKYISEFEKNGMIFVGQDEDGERMEIMELKG